MDVEPALVRRAHALEYSSEGLAVGFGDGEVQTNRAVLRAAVEGGVDEVLLERRANAFGRAVKGEEARGALAQIEAARVEQDAEQGSERSARADGAEVEPSGAEALLDLVGERE